MDSQLEKEYEEYSKQGRIWGDIPKDRIKKFAFPRVDDRTVAEFLEMDDLTGMVSDILDSMGIYAAIPASYLAPIVQDRKLVGTAITLRSIPERKTVTQGVVDKDLMRMAIRDVYYLAEPGDVLVADFGGNLDVSNMGGQSTALAMSRGLAGAVCNGAVRDVSQIRALGHPVWSRGRTMKTGKFRQEGIEINGPVTLCDVVVLPGDLIIADDSGVCVVPGDSVPTVLSKAKAKYAEETRAYELIQQNESISALKQIYRRRYGN
jgi:4-hydroxy-4-methyl-2-oxoglutarate aldolase